MNDAAFMIVVFSEDQLCNARKILPAKGMTAVTDPVTIDTFTAVLVTKVNEMAGKCARKP